jgi:hypothetical protein
LKVKRRQKEEATERERGYRKASYRDWNANGCILFSEQGRRES